MGKPLPTNSFIAIPTKRCGLECIRRLLISTIIIVVCLFITNTIKAQVIVETFEEMSASTRFPTSSATCSYAVTSSSATIEVTGTISFTTSSSASATNSARGNGGNTSRSTSCTSSTITSSTTDWDTNSSSTLGPDSTGTFSWYYAASGNGSRISICSENTSSGFHSTDFYAEIPTTSLIISPIIPQGISTVSFWVYGGASGKVVIGLRTTQTTAANNFVTYPSKSAQANTIFTSLTSSFTNTGSTYPYTTAVGSTLSTVRYSGTTSLVGVSTTSSLTGTVAGTENLFQVIYTVPTSLQGSPAQITIMASGSAIDIDDIEIFASATPGTWTGNASTDWDDINNWTYLTVPTSATDVTIPNTTNKPVLTSDAAVHNLILNTSATLSINGNTLTINGAVSGAGKLIGSSTSNLVMGGSSTGTLLFATSPGLLLNFTLNDGANITLGSPTEIVSTGTLTVGSVTGATLATTGRLILQSDNNGSARLAQVPVNGSGVSLSTISGSTNVLCYIHSTNSGVSASRRAWRLLTAPITNYGLVTPCSIYSSWQNGGVNVSGQGTMITTPSAIATGGAGNGMDAGINSNYSMYTWNVSTQKLVAVTNTKVAISNSTGNGDNLAYLIFVRGDRTPNTVNLPWFATINNTTLTSTGPLQLGNQVFSSVTTPTILTGTAGALSMVGNPYASSIDFSEVAGDVGGGIPALSSGLVNVVKRYYMWNSNLTGSQGVGGYVCIDDAPYSGSYIKSLGQVGSVSSADLSIQSGQAFFIQTMTPNASGKDSITFKEATKNTTNNFIYRPANEQGAITPIASFTASLSLLNSDSSTSLTDGVVAQFKNGYCNCVDYLDAPKFTNIDEMFSLSREGKQLCIERRSDITNADTLFLTLQQMTQRDYQFGFTTALSNYPGIGAHLEDSYTGLKTSLSMNGSNTVDFTIDGNTASKAKNRFMVVFGSPNITPAYANITAHKEGNTIPVQWSVSNDSSMTTYALQRSTDETNYTTVYTTTAQHNGNVYTWIDANPAPGIDYYRVLSTDVLNEQSYSPIATVGITALNPVGITIYPNPIQNNRIGIAMNNLAAGTYHYNLLNDLGQQIQTGSFTNPGGNATTSIPINHLLSKGTYRLEIIQPDHTTSVVNVLY
jgi:hypothetical protein